MREANTDWMWTLDSGVAVTGTTLGAESRGNTIKFGWKSNESWLYSCRDTHEGGEEECELRVSPALTLDLFLGGACRRVEDAGGSCAHENIRICATEYRHRIVLWLFYFWIIILPSVLYDVCVHVLNHPLLDFFMRALQRRVSFSSARKNKPEAHITAADCTSSGLKQKNTPFIHKSPVKAEIWLFQPEPCWIPLFTFISLFQPRPLRSCITDGRWDYCQCQRLLSLFKGPWALHTTICLQRQRTHS